MGHAGSGCGGVGSTPKVSSDTNNTLIRRDMGAVNVRTEITFLAKTLFAVSNDEEFFGKYGFLPRHIPELDRERSEVSKYKGVYAKEVVLGTGK